MTLNNNIWHTEKYIKGPIVGIDLGTSNSSVGIWLEGKNYVKIIKNYEHAKLTPSVVSFSFNDGKQKVILGNEAVANLVLNAEWTISNVKRIIGMRFDTPCVQTEIKFNNYKVIENPKNGDCLIKLPNNKELSPQEISSYVLAVLKAAAEVYCKCEVKNAVICVPAHFTESQRAATIQAGELVGLNVVRLLHEPTAAAIAYGLFVTGEKKVVVLDWGGGTFDVSLMEINEGKFSVLGLGGDNHLGGEDCNRKLLKLISKKAKLDLSNLEEGMAMVSKAAEEIKISLSKNTISYLSITRLPKLKLEAITGDSDDDVKEKASELEKKKISLICIERKEFENEIEDLLSRCISIVKQVFKEANVNPFKIQEIILVGGSTGIPKFRNSLAEYFSNKEMCGGVDPHKVVTQGAAIQAAIISGVDRELLSDVLMLDMLPHSIGLEKGNGDFEIMLPRNSNLPCKVTKQFVTERNNQRGITVNIYEGENKIASENKFLSQFNFPITDWKAPAGERNILITFEMNINGILRITSDALKEDENASSVSFLILFIIALLVTFISLKVTFNDPIILNDPSRTDSSLTNIIEEQF